MPQLGLTGDPPYLGERQQTPPNALSRCRARRSCPQRLCGHDRWLGRFALLPEVRDVQRLQRTRLVEVHDRVEVVTLTLILRPVDDADRTREALGQGDVVTVEQERAEIGTMEQIFELDCRAGRTRRCSAGSPQWRAAVTVPW